MSKFYDQIFNDIQYGVEYRYAPETFFVKYKGEDITDLITDLSFGGQEYLKGNHKKIKDSIKRGIRKNSKLSLKNKKFKFCLTLDNQKYIYSYGYCRFNRFGDINLKLDEYKFLKQHVNSAYSERASLDALIGPVKVSKESIYNGNNITGIKYI